MRLAQPAMAMTLDRIVQLAEAREDIRLLLLVGSQARATPPADQWSDLDVVLGVHDVEPYVTSTDWLEPVGAVWVSHVEPSAAGGLRERRVLFENAVDVDFVFVPDNALHRLGQDAGVSATLRRGFHVLMDKDRLMQRLTLPINPSAIYRPPTQAEFSNTINDFWYHAAWTTKRLRRGELWLAKSACDGYMKALLLRLIEWHARAIGRQNADTWYGGRFLEQWADPQVVSDLRLTFAHYDRDDVERALLATMDLFRRLAQETAVQLNYSYPTDSDTQVTRWVTDTLAAR